jgi:lipid II:glycine glycyltransferase (peptidoglycan interpeptide bridge formation enzyme)
LETSIYDLDVHNFGELASATKSTRKNLRHAQKIEIVQVKSEEEIKQYFKELSRIKGRKDPEERELEANAKYSSHRFLFLAQDPFSGKCVGTLGFIHDNYMAVEIASSTLKGPEMRGVQEKLHLHAFDMAKKSGLRKFDLAGLERESGGDWNSIAKFKLKFGGTIVTQGFIEVDIRKAE